MEEIEISPRGTWPISKLNLRCCRSRQEGEWGNVRIFNLRQNEE